MAFFGDGAARADEAIKGSDLYMYQVRLNADLTRHAAPRSTSLGSRFCEFSIADGRKVTETQLDCTPIFDGLIAAGGRLYLATTDGSIICFGR